MSKNTYIPSSPGSPYVSRAKKNPPEETEPEKVSQQVPGQNLILNSMTPQRWVDSTPLRKYTPSKRRLRDCNEDEARVLGVRCYHSRWIYKQGDEEVSYRLDIAIEDLDTLWKHEPVKMLLPTLPNPEFF